MDIQPRSSPRLRGGLSGTNLELTGDYNQRWVYQAIRTRGPITRNELIELTGLAKPTVAGIVRRLLGSDLVVETSRLYGGRGQPAAHLEINPDGCYSIGVHVDQDRLELVSINACGEAISRATASLPSAAAGRASGFFRRQFLGLTRDVRRERIIGLGVAMAGNVVSGHDRHVALGGDGTGIDLLTLSEIAPGVPIYVDTDLAAATAGESLFGRGSALRSYYYILLGASPVGGLVVQQALFKGVHPAQQRLLFPGAALAWCRTALAAAQGEGAGAPDEAWLAAACDDLLPLLISINCLLNPGGVLLGGRFPGPWLAALAARCDDRLRERAPEIPSHAGIGPAQLAADATLIGAATLPMRARLFPTGEALLKTPDHAG
jgi:predicted NBD/HSP70 family sugar kinase